MKCAVCGKSTRYKARRENGGRCSSCRHEFAFEPKNEQPKVTDEMFRRAIDLLSDRGRLKFTPRQLNYELDRRVHRWNWGSIGGGAIIPGIGLTYLLFKVGAPIVLLPVGLIALGLILAAKWRNDHVARKADEFDALRLLNRWERTHSPIQSLFRWSADQAQSGSIDPELRDYGFDRALVADRSETAAWLVENHFHLDYECAVLSLDGYPHGLRDDLVEVLRKNPNLKVMALHDASSIGCRTPLRLRDPRWFPAAEIAVMDLGLRPTQAAKQRLAYVADINHSVDLGTTSILKPVDVKLLEKGRMYELAAIPPGRLIQTISRGFGVMATGAPGTTTGSDSGIYYYGDYSDSDNGGDGDGGFG